MSFNISLVDELTQKQPLKFQINGLKDVKVNKIKSILLENDEGILNLNSSIREFGADLVKAYLTGIKDYNFALNYNVTNYEIMFKKKETGVKN